ncbi:MULTISPECIES: cytochrome d ubiquinol oxidase subunit II [Streptomyces]|jgi:cytochrome d ubiquinol oxidase subunit II|uniref:cytochrome d ubiquinol oxidase subunit II n=1 Tax=Streptomyces TaxID=1883 RepID=UPI000BB15EF0|nr:MULTISPECIES: cytochrome d ubiquinol oxidase subunit II [Streptomyces]MCT9110589.1 cytochrome d ubiquinol oxidase subunit II [Streptomyces mirabilis]MCX4435103.1 cytochrome d ubiquinol oxidase subunit II [Streptomyces mirabilis]PBC97757.1 cytochrome bd-I ubiquinol oxidase subunit 2 apoprotein [Streptomyces sp. Ag82_O1-15]SOE72182.1 cytochrome bd-I ubiquinol oxidase subunit 2 apoprotein [Streptomyces sp. OV198]
MELHDVWFVIIAVLWTGYFFLEGFDFGVGVLTKLLARDRTEKRVLINTIGPVWDGNEVWLLSAGGATFAAFPEWYATLFSGFYLPLLLILVCLIVRGVAFEYRVKRPEENWQRNWEAAIFWTSLVPAFMWGVAFGNIVHGVKIDKNFEYVGNFGDLLNPYALLGGLVTLTLFTFHGTVFVGLKTVGDIRERARKLSLGVGLVAAVVALVFLIWTQADNGDAKSLAALIVAVVALVAAIAVAQTGREGWAFALSGLTIVAAVAMLFLTLFPNVMPSSLNPDWSLTVSNASSSPYTLRIMTWCAGIATPMVLLYQSWTYWVFRKRIGTHHIAADAAH